MNMEQTKTREDSDFIYMQGVIRLNRHRCGENEIEVGFKNKTGNACKTKNPDKTTTPLWQLEGEHSKKRFPAIHLTDTISPFSAGPYNLRCWWAWLSSQPGQCSQGEQSRNFPEVICTDFACSGCFTPSGCGSRSSQKVPAWPHHFGNLVKDYFYTQHRFRWLGVSCSTDTS